MSKRGLFFIAALGGLLLALLGLGKASRGARKYSFLA
jgi:hypothetical protein